MTDVWIGYRVNGSYEGSDVLVVAASLASAQAWVEQHDADQGRPFLGPPRPRRALPWRPCRFDDDVDDPTEHSATTVWAEGNGARYLTKYRIECHTVQP